MNKRKKDKNHDKDAHDETREVNSYMSEGKNLYEKSSSTAEVQQALLLFSKAISMASSVQVLHLNHIYHMRGLCYLKLKKYSLAERDFQEAIAISDDKSKVSFYNSLGKCKVEMNQADPHNVNLQEGIKCFEKALDCSNHLDGESFFNLGLVYRKMKKNFQAIKEFENALNYLKYPDQFQAHIEKGICYRDIGEIENSIDDFLKACEIKRDDPLSHFHLGINYLINNNYDAALEKLSTAIEINKLEPQFYNYKALVLYMSGQYDQCLIIFYQALKLYEQRECNSLQVGECWYNTGNALLNLGRVIDALEAFEKTTQYEMDLEMKIKVLYSQGRAYEYQSNPEAIPKFKECIELIGENRNNDLYLSSFYHLGLNQEKHRQLPEAVESLSRILDAECNDRCVYEARGKVYLKNEQYQDALRDFETVAACSQNYPDVYYYRGLAKTFLKDTDAAIEDLFKVLELGSKNYGVYNGISLAYLTKNQFEKALIYSNIALEKEPLNEEFLIQRSRIYLELNQYLKGIEDLSKAIGVNDKNPLVYYRRGLAYYKNKEYDAAIRDLEHSLEYHPSKNIQSDIFYHIGIAYANLQKFSESIEPLSQAIELEEIPRYFHQRAKSELLLDQNVNALNDLNKVISEQPENAFAYFRRGFAHKALKMYDEAAEDFLRARQLTPEDPRVIINKKQIYQIKYRKLCDAGQEL